jgi:hypothetical protein
MPNHPDRELPQSDVQPTEPMIAGRPSQGGSWIALTLAAIVLIAVGYFLLKPDVPSPNMRAAETPPATTPAPR